MDKISYTAHCTTAASYTIRPWQGGKHQRVYVNVYQSNGKKSGSVKYPQNGYFDGKELIWFGIDTPDEILELFESEARALWAKTFGIAEHEDASDTLIPQESENSLAL